MDIRIRPASPEDADIAAKLTFMAYHKYSYDIFGKIGEEAATNYYKKLWIHGHNRFGYRYSYIAEYGQTPVGMMTAYPARLINELSSPTIRQLVRIGKVRFVFHFITHLSNFFYFSGTAGTSPNEFYVSTLSVLPRYRGNGIGSQMIKHAFKLTREHKYKQCSLHVLVENAYGIRFYQKNGFAKYPAAAKDAYFRMVYSV